MDYSEESRSLLDNLEDSNSPTPLDIIKSHQMTNIPSEELVELSEKERMVIAPYYHEELTQKEIEEILTVSEGRISQLHSQALLKLKVKLTKLNLAEGI